MVENVSPENPAFCLDDQAPLPNGTSQEQHIHDHNRCQAYVAVKAL